MVANRALDPYSKLYCWEQWLREEVFLPSAGEVGLQHLYRAMDFLEENKADVEKSVYFAMADLMNADVDLHLLRHHLAALRDRRGGPRPCWGGHFPRTPQAWVLEERP